MYCVVVCFVLLFVLLICIDLWFSLFCVVLFRFVVCWRVCLFVDWLSCVWFVLNCFVCLSVCLFCLVCFVFVDLF